jgi:hypothetical protein
LFTFFISVNFLSSLSIDSFENSIDEFSKALQHVYIVLLLFINTTLTKFVIDLFIIYTEQDQLILSGAQIVRRASKAIATAVIGGGVAGVAVSISPAVELPGVNESQIYLGRGYGYKTSIDW